MLKYHIQVSKLHSNIHHPQNLNIFIIYENFMHCCKFFRVHFSMRTFYGQKIFLILSIRIFPILICNNFRASKKNPKDLCTSPAECRENCLSCVCFSQIFAESEHNFKILRKLLKFLLKSILPRHMGLPEARISPWVDALKPGLHVLLHGTKTYPAGILSDMILSSIYVFLGADFFISFAHPPNMYLNFQVCITHHLQVVFLIL